mmetsp:Transcript_30069/g.74061  ORF Transcript_30069/g.74061 Transcript_30069/m.74061 type:complete len:342 (-) Transcript_30069:231-1256(-)
MPTPDGESQSVSSYRSSRFRNRTPARPGARPTRTQAHTPHNTHTKHEHAHVCHHRARPHSHITATTTRGGPLSHPNKHSNLTAAQHGRTFELTRTKAVQSVPIGRLACVPGSADHASDPGPLASHSGHDHRVTTPHSMWPYVAAERHGMCMRHTTTGKGPSHGESGVARTLYSPGHREALARCIRRRAFRGRHTCGTIHSTARRWSRVCVCGAHPTHATPHHTYGARTVTLSDNVGGAAHGARVHSRIRCTHQMLHASDALNLIGLRRVGGLTHVLGQRELGVFEWGVARGRRRHQQVRHGIESLEQDGHRHQHEAGAKLPLDTQPVPHKSTHARSATGYT